MKFLIILPLHLLSSKIVPDFPFAGKNFQKFNTPTSSFNLPFQPRKSVKKFLCIFWVFECKINNSILPDWKLTIKSWNCSNLLLAHQKITPISIYFDQQITITSFFLCRTKSNWTLHFGPKLDEITNFPWKLSRVPTLKLLENEVIVCTSRLFLKPNFKTFPCRKISLEPHIIKN